MLRPPRLTRHPIALAAGLALAATWAHAQTTPDTSTQAATTQQQRSAVAAPETVVVTATRRSETASKIPFNITAITEEALREENITDLKKLIQSSVAINAPDNPARFADSVTVRGLNVSPVNANNLEQFTRSTISYYLDDTPLPNIGLRIKDIARVEQLLGPQGTLYGAGALGGTFRYITNKPRLGKTEARLNASLWQVDGGGLSNDLDGVFNLPLGQNIALRGSFARLDEKGWIDRISNPPWRTGSNAWTTKPDANTNLYEDDNWQRVDSGRLALLWQPTKAIQLLLSHAQQDQLANGTGAVSRLPLTVANARNAAERDAAWQNPQRTNAQQPCQPNCAYANGNDTPFAVNDRTLVSRYPEFADRQFRLTAFDIDVDFGFATLHSSTSRFKDSRIGEADYASQGWNFYSPQSPILAGFDLGGDIRSQRSAFMTFDNTYTGTSHETRLTSKGDGAWDWIAGVFHTKQNRNLRFAEVLPGMDAYINRPGGVGKAQASPLPDQGYTEDLGSRYKETAVFGEVGYRITPQWRLNVGARAFDYKDTANVNIVDWAGGVVDNQYTATGGDSGKSYYKVNTSYQATENLLAYLTYSQGFRRGGTNPFRNRGTRVVAPDAAEYQPDSTDNLELGVKGYLFDRQLYLEAAVYQIDWNNTQTYREQLVNDFPVNGTVNGPDARSRGFEFSSRWRISPDWSLTYSTATTEAKWVGTKTHCIYTNNTECRTWNEGGLLGGAPKWRHNVGVRFARLLANDLYLTASLTARYVGQVQSDRADTVAQNLTVARYPAYTRYNANVGVSRDAWSASLWINNLTNQRVLVSNQAAGIMGVRDITITPRTIGLNLSYTFK